MWKKCGKNEEEKELGCTCRILLKQKLIYWCVSYLFYVGQFISYPGLLFFFKQKKLEFIGIHNYCIKKVHVYCHIEKKQVRCNVWDASK